MSGNASFRVVFNEKDINRLIRVWEERKVWLNQKAEELARKLAERGYLYASVVMSGHIYSGETLASLAVEQTGPMQYTVKANSTAVLFLEFGSGIGGIGHPEAGENKMGAGTYPGQKYAFNPNGWWFPTDDPLLIVHTDSKGQGWGHSRGMAPAMPMYSAVTGVERDLESIIREVFAS